MPNAFLFVMVTSMAVTGLDGARSCYFVDGTYQTPRKVTCTVADNQYCFTMTGTVAEIQKGCADDTTYGLRSKNITCTQNGKNPVPATLDLPPGAELDCCDTDYCNDGGGNTGGPSGPGGSGPGGPTAGPGGPGGSDPGGSGAGGPGGSGPGSPGGKSPGGSGDRALVSLSIVSLAVAMLYA